MQNYDFSGLREAFLAHQKLAYPIGQDGEGLLQIDGATGVIDIYWPATTAAPDLTQFQNLGVRAGVIPGSDVRAWVLRIQSEPGDPGALALAGLIVDRLDRDEGLQSSVRSSLQELKHLLARFVLISRGREVGLVGELLFLRHLAKHYGDSAAIRSWLGPPREPHDFFLSDFDVEAKTTEGERRIHTVSSETQLMPSPGRRLFLLSIQLSEAGADGKGQSLRQLVDEARSRAGDATELLEYRLLESGWDDQLSDLYTTRFVFRSVPQIFEIGPDFPAITRPAIDSLPGGERLASIRYRVDLTGLEPEPDFPEPLQFGLVVDDE